MASTEDKTLAMALYAKYCDQYDDFTVGLDEGGFVFINISEKPRNIKLPNRYKNKPLRYEWVGSSALGGV